MQREIIVNYVSENGYISNKEARDILGLSESTTKRLLKTMVEEHLLDEEGERKSRRYIIIIHD